MQVDSDGELRFVARLGRSGADAVGPVDKDAKSKCPGGGNSHTYRTAIVGVGGVALPSPPVIVRAPEFNF